MEGEEQIMVDDDWLFLFLGLDADAAKAVQGLLLNRDMQKEWKDAGFLMMQPTWAQVPTEQKVLRKVDLTEHGCR